MHRCRYGADVVQRCRYAEADYNTKINLPTIDQIYISEDAVSINKISTFFSSLFVGSQIIWETPPSPETIGKKGIDISGKIGDDILSSSDGMVVYTGNGIKGYGNLIIIKHNETFLSAYAHTSKILVEENNLVKKGQVIAKLGDTYSIKPILHFQKIH